MTGKLEKLESVREENNTEKIFCCVQVEGQMLLYIISRVKSKGANQESWTLECCLMILKAGNSILHENILTYVKIFIYWLEVGGM